MRQRKLNRKNEYDYTTDGWYFVTTVTEDRKNWFGEIQNNKMVLYEYGEIVQKQWIWLHNQYPYLKMDEYIVMPNHFHGILNINSLRDKLKIKSISELMGAFKTTSSKLIHAKGLKEFSWQRSFHDRIIRDEKECINIKNYIINNPTNWENDKNNMICPNVT